MSRQKQTLLSLLFLLLAMVVTMLKQRRKPKVYRVYSLPIANSNPNPTQTEAAAE